MENIKALMEAHPILKEVAAEREVAWINPDRLPFAEAEAGQELTMADIIDAENRLKRFAPFIMKRFPETESQGGLIESELAEIPKMRARLNEKYGANLEGRLLLKKDSHLAIAGSIKARGGIYEVLKHTEDLALERGLLTPAEVADNSGANAAYLRLASDEARAVFSQYTVQVGSTGNLGMSIGIMSAAVGFRVIVHMSADAKQWKKDLLRSHGVTVIEYESDYSEAVRNGRAQSDADTMSYYVDDENSRNLFLGYAVAARRLVSQLDVRADTLQGYQRRVVVTSQHHGGHLRVAKLGGDGLGLPDQFAHHARGLAVPGLHVDPKLLRHAAHAPFLSPTLAEMISWSFAAISRSVPSIISQVLLLETVSTSPFWEGEPHMH